MKYIFFHNNESFKLMNKSWGYTCLYWLLQYYKMCPISSSCTVLLFFNGQFNFRMRVFGWIY